MHAAEVAQGDPAGHRDHRRAHSGEGPAEPERGGDGRGRQAQAGGGSAEPTKRIYSVKAPGPRNIPSRAGRRRVGAAVDGRRMRPLGSASGPVRRGGCPGAAGWAAGEREDGHEPSVRPGGRGR
ncbi:hypothetical protein Pve01_61140 [Planomonospora venezuelensis]|nr:hypothetical protein Pve01_61140 [Planomonospora venezuelensis]